LKGNCAFRGKDVHTCLDTVTGLFIDIFRSSSKENIPIRDITDQRNFMVHHLNSHFRIDLPFEMVTIKTSLNKQPKSVRAVPAEVKDGWSSNPLIHLLMNGKEKILIGLGANEVSGRMIRDHDRISASA